MAAADSPCGLPSPAQLGGKFLEQIPATRKAEADDARPDVAGDDQLHVTVRYSITVQPSLELDLVDFDAHRSVLHSQHGVDARAGEMAAGFPESCASEQRRVLLER